MAIGSKEAKEGKEEACRWLDKFEKIKSNLDHIGFKTPRRLEKRKIQ